MKIKSLLEEIDLDLFLERRADIKASYTLQNRMVKEFKVKLSFFINEIAEEIEQELWRFYRTSKDAYDLRSMLCDQL